MSRGQDLLIDVLVEDDAGAALERKVPLSEPGRSLRSRRLGLPTVRGSKRRMVWIYVLRLPAKGPDRPEDTAQIDSMGNLAVGTASDLPSRRAPVWSHGHPRFLVLMRFSSRFAIGPRRVPQLRRRLVPLPHRRPRLRLRIRQWRPSQLRRQLPLRRQLRLLLHRRRLLIANWLLTAVREPSTLLLWNEVQAVQVQRAADHSEDAFVLFDGETPQQVKWVPPVAALFGLFVLLNLYYLARLRSRPEE